MEVVVNQMDGAAVVTDDPETNSELAILDCDPSLFVDQHVREDISKTQAKLKVCSRCTQKGHVAADCSSELYCDICDSVEHVNHRCPVLKQSRPAAHAMGYSVDGLGFFHIPHPPLQKSKKGSKTALVRIEGGCLTKEKAVSQLQRIISTKWKWEPVEHEENSFVVPFPSKIELQRAIAYGGADVKENGVLTGARLKFEEWNEKEEGFLLPKVWVRVFGLRKKLREYLNIWAVGSLLGATQTMDMKMTRKNDFGRIFVAVLNPRIIPKNLDVVIGDHFFELEIEVEKMGFDENGKEVEIEQDDRDGDGLEENKEDKHDGDGRDGRVTKRAKNDDMLVDGKENGTAEGKYDAALNGNQCQHKMKESEISAIASGILDVAVGKVMNEVCDMVIEETEQPIEEEELPLDSNLGDEEKGEQEQEQKQEELTLVENNIEEAFKERVARAANIKETVMTPKRSVQGWVATVECTLWKRHGRI